jgi:hypothetical protein
MWMTNGRRFNVKLSHFAQILGLSSQLDTHKKLHPGRVIMPREMTLCTSRIAASSLSR